MLRTVLQVISAALIMALGIYIIVLPGNFLAAVALALSLYMVFDGIRSLLTGLRFRHLAFRLVLPAFIKGGFNLLLGLVLTLVVLRNRQSLALWLVYLIAADLLLTAAVDGLECFFLHKAREDRGSLLVDAVFSAVLSVLLFIFPSITASVFFSVAGAVVFAGGVLLLYSQINSWVVRRRYQNHRKEVLQRHTDIYDD